MVRSEKFSQQCAAVFQNPDCVRGPGIDFYSVPATILDILRVFYRTGAAFLPVVDGDTLVGIIGRDALTARASDASRAEQEFDRVPDELLLPEPFEPDVFSAIGSVRHCTVVSPDGQSSQIETQAREQIPQHIGRRLSSVVHTGE